MKLKNFFWEKEIENQKIGGKLYGAQHPKNPKLVQNSVKALDGTINVHDDTEIKKINTQKELAMVADVSHDTISKVEKIYKMATSDELEKVKTEKISINQMYHNLKKKRKWNPTESNNKRKCWKNQDY